MVMFFRLMITLSVSILMTKIIIYISDTHAKISLDHDTSGIQKMHDHVVPRVGGLAIFVALSFTALYGANVSAVWTSFYCGVVTSAFIVFIGGLTEDLSKAVSPAVRIFFMCIAVAIACFVTHSMPLIKHLDHQIIDRLVAFDVVAFAITCFAVVGISNSFNIIDGYNGLSSMTAMISALVIAYLAWQLNDYNVLFVSMSLFAAIAGFFIFNYPHGRIFLGDGGAYSVGFIIALLALNLVEGHSGEISPFAALLIVSYPFTETVFSIVRRKFIHKTKSTEPDNLHMHQLVFDRCLPVNLSLIYRNSRVMPLMTIFIWPPALATMLFYKSTVIMLSSIVLYVIFYVYFYFRLVHFKTPKFLIFKAKLMISNNH
ncbi:MAG: hypothetical protein EKK64_02010 [Neisseriaceae bacterium]|nr:MAG: hypothetical protein EKK64_02010 [Neisseriaceae bacterium]